MSRYFGFFLATLVGIGFGKDVFQPVKRGALELGAGTVYAQGFGKYNAEGDFTGFKEGYTPAVSAVSFSGKYGVGDGVDLKADWGVAFTNEDAGKLKGMTQPRVGIKYTGSMGGLFTNVSLPYAPGDFDNGNLSTILEVGGLVRKRLHHFRFVGLVSYLDNFRADSTLRVSIGRLTAQPEIVWRRGLSTYFNLEYLKSMNKKNADLLSLTAGVRTDVSSDAFCDVGAGATLGGHNAPAAWGLKASLTWTLFR